MYLCLFPPLGSEYSKVCIVVTKTNVWSLQFNWVRFESSTDLTQWDERCCSDESHRCSGAVWCSDSYSAHPQAGRPEYTRLPWMWWDIFVLEKIFFFFFLKRGSGTTWTAAVVCLLCRIKTTLKIKNLFTHVRISPWAVCRAQRRLNLTASKTFRSYSLLLHESLLEQRGEKNHLSHENTQ